MPIVVQRPLIVMVLLLGMVVPASAQTQDEMIAKGRAIATEHCARCHATGSEGASPHEKAPPFRLVVERYPSEDLAEALAEGIVTGHKDMPIFVFDPPAIEAFLAYLDSFGPSTAPKGDKPKAASGKPTAK